MMFGRKLKNIISDLQQLGISDETLIAKIDIDFQAGNKEILVDVDDDNTVEIYTKKTSHWVRDY